MEPIKVNFQIKGIELLEINMQHPQVLLNAERSYHFNINIEQRINNEEKLVIAITSVNLVHEEDQQIHASIKTSCIFSIENFEDFLTGPSDKVNFPDQFIITINSISLSTTRGIMFTSFKGTFMHNVLLPIVDPTGFITQKT